MMIWRFTPAEIGEFFNQVKGMGLTRAQSNRISRLTEGWAGSLMILSNSIAGLDKNEVDAFLERMAPITLQKDLFRFF